MKHYFKNLIKYSITLQEGKPFSNHTKASLFNTQFLKTTITIKLIKRRMNKRSFGSSIPMNLVCFSFC